MIQTAVAAFVGCLSALITMAEVSVSSKWLKYLVVLLVGAVVTVVLALVLGWMLAKLGQAH